MTATFTITFHIDDDVSGFAEAVDTAEATVSEMIEHVVGNEAVALMSVERKPSGMQFSISMQGTDCTQAEVEEFAHEITVNLDDLAGLPVVVLHVR